MKKTILTILAVFWITFGYSQIKMMNVNIKKDTIIKKEIVDSTKKVAAVKDAVIVQQSKTLEAVNDTVAAKEKKITELEKATTDWLLNGKPVYFILFGLLWVFLGVMFVWCMTALIGMMNPTNQTPTKWSWAYFLSPKNVVKRILSITASFILAFAIMVFFDKITHLALSMFYCFGIGLTLDLLIHWAFKYRKKFIPIDMDNEPNTTTTTTPSNNQATPPNNQ